MYSSFTFWLSTDLFFFFNYFENQLKTATILLNLTVLWVRDSGRAWLDDLVFHVALTETIHGIRLVAELVWGIQDGLTHQPAALAQLPGGLASAHPLPLRGLWASPCALRVSPCSHMACLCGLSSRVDALPQTAQSPKRWKAS